ncbi:MAG: four helix bundle protein [bacterium]
MKKDNLILNKSYQFSLRVIKLYRFLSEKKREFVLSKQVLRSGTGIGANVEEAIGAQSKKDFVSKMSIAYKETRETRYWIRLLKDSQYVDERAAESLLNDCEELCKIIGAIQKTSKINS